MALAVDGSSPAVVQGSTTTTSTASFTPPANAAYVAFVHSDAGNASTTEQCTVSGGGLSWSLKARHNGSPGANVEIWYAYSASAPGTITIDCTDNQGAVAKRLLVRVFTGADPAVLGASNTAAAASLSYTSTGANSWGWAAFLGPTAYSADTAQTLVDNTTSGPDADSVCTDQQNATTTTVGTTVTMSVVTTNAPYHAVAVEVLAASAAAPSAVAGPWTQPTPGGIGPTGRATPWFGTGFDVSLASIALADTGTGSDAVATTATVPVADAGAGSDAIAASATVSLADSGTVADALAAAAAVPLTEAGSGADALTATATAPLTDAGTAADTLTAAVTLPLADAGTAADAVAAGVPIAVTDSGAGSDALGAAATVPLAESGAAADALSVSVTLAVTDVGSAADVVRVVATLAFAEAASALDALGVVAAGATAPGTLTPTTTAGRLATTTVAGQIGGATTSAPLTPASIAATITPRTTGGDA